MACVYAIILILGIASATKPRVLLAGVGLSMTDTRRTRMCGGALCVRVCFCFKTFDAQYLVVDDDDDDRLAEICVYVRSCVRSAHICARVRAWSHVHRELEHTNTHTPQNHPPFFFGGACVHNSKINSFGSRERACGYIYFE